MTVIDEYLEKIEETKRNELERIRRVIKATVPEADEVIDYGMPAFKYKGQYLIGFHVFKNHMSLFPTALPISAMKTKLTGFQISKGSIQFTLANPIPDAIIRNLLLYKIDSIDKLVE
jgi:uncharacterized protein YdhG (YjbR/CyaY superfamily)